MIDRIFEFITDPFGIRRKREKRELEELIKNCNRLSKEFTEVLLSDTLEPFKSHKLNSIQNEIKRL